MGQSKRISTATQLECVYFPTVVGQTKRMSTATQSECVYFPTVVGHSKRISTATQSEYIYFPHCWNSPARWHRQLLPQRLQRQVLPEQQSLGRWWHMELRRMQDLRNNRIIEGRL